MSQTHWLHLLFKNVMLSGFTVLSWNLDCNFFEHVFIIIFYIMSLIHWCMTLAGSLLLHAVLSDCGEQGYFLVTVLGLLIAVATLVLEHKL